jgi:GAF domain-containing protein
MTALNTQIDTLEALLKHLRTGDPEALNEIPVILRDLRRGIADLERRQEELASLYRAGHDIASILNLDQLLQSILDRALVLVGAERGFLVLCNPSDDGFQVPVVRWFDRGEVGSAEREISDGIIKNVLTSREPLVTTSTLEDPRFKASPSIVYQIRSVLAAPMITKAELIGAIYVDAGLSARLFDESDLALLASMASQAGVAIQLARLYENLQARNLELQETVHQLRQSQ